MHRINRISIALVAACAVIATSLPVEAGRGQNNVRAQSQKNVNVNSNRNKNTNVNINSRHNTNVNVNVDVDHRGGCCYHDDYHPIATIATVAITAAVVGSIVSASSMPPGCSTVIVNGLGYQQCGSTWYQPQVSGSTTTYIVVNQPH
jgi:hypothetical protein